MNKNLSEFTKKVYDLLKEQPDECYGIATEYEDFVRHKSTDIDEFIKESYKNGKTIEKTTEDLIEEVQKDPESPVTEPKEAPVVAPIEAPQIAKLTPENAPKCDENGQLSLF